MPVNRLVPFINKNANLKIVHTFSDEASGYNQKVSSDIALANKFKKYFPQMNLGGFTQSGKNDLAILNSMFDYGLYSSLSKNDVSDLVKNKKLFGLYNAAQNATDDPRFVFGLGMYLARKAGISYYLEWNSIGFNNYPYFDFDGRESDVVLFYPNSNGDLYNSLRFELAHSGLNNLRKLQLIETLIESGPDY